MDEPFYRFHVACRGDNHSGWYANVRELPGCQGHAATKPAAVHMAMARTLRTIATRLEDGTADAALLNGLFEVEK